MIYGVEGCAQTKEDKNNLTTLFVKIYKNVVYTRVKAVSIL